MTAIDDAAYQQLLGASELARKYATPIDRESAHEILQKKLQSSTDEDDAPAQDAQPAAKSGGRAAKPEKSMLEEVLDNRTVKTVGRQVARTVVQQVVRGIFGMLKSR
jgi:phage I-like protein